MPGRFARIVDAHEQVPPPVFQYDNMSFPPTCHDITNFKKIPNEARMSMKTKNDDKKSGSTGVEKPSSREPELKTRLQ